MLYELWSQKASNQSYILRKKNKTAVTDKNQVLMSDE